MNKEQIAKLKELAQAMPSAPFGYSFGTGYVARKTENSYFHVAQAPSGMSSTMEWERSASFIAALLEAAPELIALAERALLAAAPAPIQQVPTLIAYVATDLDGHYDVGTTPEKAKQRAGHGCDTVFPIYDIGDNATPPALAGSQVQDGD